MPNPRVNRPEPYDPLNYRNLAASVVRALMAQPRVTLPPDPFEGVGVYAIYYDGAFAPYASIRTSDKPVYVGSAVPAGKRKGGIELEECGRSLYARLTQHAKSISQARNLRLDDFKCRYLVVVPVWISLAERFLIEHYRPIWNTVIDGFGNHDPGMGRRNMKRPRWDILHPGREWAERLRPAETADRIISELG